jgi:plastocyanin
MLKPQLLRSSAGCCEPNPNTPQRAAGLNMLDSRAIGRASCYAQRFMRPGTYDYAVAPGHGQALAAEFPFRVVVTEDKSREMAQHNVLVSDGKRGFYVDREELQIALGDMVLWTGGGRTSAPFAIVGEHEFFNSHRMVNECGYSHAFGTPGEYEWADAHGSGLGGRIRVSEVDGRDAKAFTEWRKRLHEGALVMIQNGKADRNEIDIMVGQTVFFAIVTSPGISITDTRLLDLSASPSRKAAKVA